MSLQRIFNISQDITINNRRVANFQAARSGVIKTSEYVTAVPWQITVTPHNYLDYSKTRDIIQAIDNADKNIYQTVYFNDSNSAIDNSKLSWFLKYQGDNSSTPTTITMTAYSGNTVTLSTLPSITSTQYLFRAGDFIQLPPTSYATSNPSLGTGRYVYKVKTDVLRGAASTVSVTLHRAVIGTVSSGAINCGDNCYFELLMTQCPTYTLRPGWNNSAMVAWNGSFQCYENLIG